jgi:hypothetical protein
MPSAGGSFIVSVSWWIKAIALTASGGASRRLTAIHRRPSLPGAAARQLAMLAHLGQK